MLFNKRNHISIFDQTEEAFPSTRTCRGAHGEVASVFSPSFVLPQIRIVQMFVVNLSDKLSAFVISDSIRIQSFNYDTPSNSSTATSMEYDYYTPCDICQLHTMNGIYVQQCLLCVLGGHSVNKLILRELERMQLLMFHLCFIVLIYLIIIFSVLSVSVPLSHPQNQFTWI